MKNKKRALMVVGGLALVTALAAPAVTADPPRPPKEAVDQLNAILETPSENGAGVIDAAKDTGGALILRDPQTGNVLRDPATGLPLLARDENGNIKRFRAQDVPAEQRVAQARHDEKQERAAKGDVQAQKELRDEVEKTAQAVKEHPNGN